MKTNKRISLIEARADVLTHFEESLAYVDNLEELVMYYYEAELPSNDAGRILDEYNRNVGPAKLVVIDGTPYIEIQVHEKEAPDQKRCSEGDESNDKALPPLK